MFLGIFGKLLKPNLFKYFGYFSIESQKLKSRCASCFFLDQSIKKIILPLFFEISLTFIYFLFLGILTKLSKPYLFKCFALFTIYGQNLGSNMHELKKLRPLRITNYFSYIFKNFQIINFAIVSLNIKEA